MNLNKFVGNQKKLYEGGYLSVTSKRNQWDDFFKRAENIFTSLKNELEVQGFKGKIYIVSNLDSALEETKNQNFIGIKMGIQFTGISKRIIEPLDGKVSGKHILEWGGQLIFSQSPRGEVVAFIYPSKSDVISLNLKNGYLLHKIYSCPCDIKEKDLEKAVKKFFWLAYISSCFSYMGIYDRLWLCWYQIDLREFGKNFTAFIKDVLGIVSKVNVGGSPLP